MPFSNPRQTQLFVFFVGFVFAFTLNNCVNALHCLTSIGNNVNETNIATPTSYEEKSEFCSESQSNFCISVYFEADQINQAELIAVQQCDSGVIPWPTRVSQFLRPTSQLSCHHSASNLTSAISSFHNVIEFWSMQNVTLEFSGNRIKIYYFCCNTNNCNVVHGTLPSNLSKRLQSDTFNNELADDFFSNVYENKLSVATDENRSSGSGAMTEKKDDIAVNFATSRNHHRKNELKLEAIPLIHDITTPEVNKGSLLSVTSSFLDLESEGGSGETSITQKINSKRNSKIQTDKTTSMLSQITSSLITTISPRHESNSASALPASHTKMHQESGSGFLDETSRSGINNPTELESEQNLFSETIAFTTNQSDETSFTINSYTSNQSINHSTDTFTNYVTNSPAPKILVAETSAAIAETFNNFIHSAEMHDQFSPPPDHPRTISMDINYASGEEIASFTLHHNIVPVNDVTTTFFQDNNNTNAYSKESSGIGITDPISKTELNQSKVGSASGDENSFDNSFPELSSKSAENIGNNDNSKTSAFTLNSHEVSSRPSSTSFETTTSLTLPLSETSIFGSGIEEEYTTLGSGPELFTNEYELEKTTKASSLHSINRLEDTVSKSSSTRLASFASTVPTLEFEKNSKTNLSFHTQSFSPFTTNAATIFIPITFPQNDTQQATHKVISKTENGKSTTKSGGVFTEAASTTNAVNIFTEESSPTEVRNTVTRAVDRTTTKETSSTIFTQASSATVNRTMVNASIVTEYAQATVFVPLTKSVASPITKQSSSTVSNNKLTSGFNYDISTPKTITTASTAMNTVTEQDLSSSAYETFFTTLPTPAPTISERLEVLSTQASKTTSTLNYSTGTTNLSVSLHSSPPATFIPSASISNITTSRTLDNMTFQSIFETSPSHDKFTSNSISTTITSSSFASTIFSENSYFSPGPETAQLASILFFVDFKTDIFNLEFIQKLEEKLARAYASAITKQVSNFDKNVLTLPFHIIAIL